MIMCHMIADTPGELTRMADLIGVQRRWFQRRASVPHFDICRSKRELALLFGAHEATRAEFVAVMRRIRSLWPRDPLGDWSLESQ
jgi:hypothetical protein